MGFSSIMQHACLSQFVVKKAMTNWHFVVWTRHALSIAVWCLEPLVCQRLWGSDGSHRHWLTLACCALKVGRADSRRFWWLSDQYGWKILLVSLLSAFPTCGRLISIATACADSTVKGAECFFNQFPAAHLEIRAVEMDVKSLRVSCNCWHAASQMDHSSPKKIQPIVPSLHLLWLSLGIIHSFLCFWMVRGSSLLFVTTPASWLGHHCLKTDGAFVMQMKGCSFHQVEVQSMAFVFGHWS